MPAPDENPSPLELGKAAATQIGAAEWHIDAEAPGGPGDDSGEPGALAPGAFLSPTYHAQGSPPPNSGARDDSPPSPEQLVEAMLFTGGPPLTPPVACSAIRGLTAERFHAAVDALNKRYRSQNRPYSVVPRDDGFVLTILPAYRGLRERLFGGPRESRLSQQAVDVLAVIAYRQPVSKSEIDAIRGTDSGVVLRQLVRLGLAAVQHRAENGSLDVRYGTTSRFLQVFGLANLDELPSLGDTAQL
jgi:segregation and condensation protein B